MAMTIVEGTRSITGGVDTHLDVHVAAALDHIGGLLGVESFEASSTGNDKLLGWLASFGQVAKVGIEGTGSYGASLARSLRAADVCVVEVDRPNRQARRRTGKSDPADAVEAARAALSGRAQGGGKTRDGNVEAIRALVVAKRSAKSTRIKSMNQIRHLGFTAPDELRERLRGVSRDHLGTVAASLRPRADGDPVLTATKTAIRILGRRVLALDQELAAIDNLLRPSSPPRRPASSACMASAWIAPPRCWSLPVTTPNGCDQKPPGPTSAASPPSRRRRARSHDGGSTAAVTATPTVRSGSSSSPG
jgi:transposase